jgi:hypothetical protein
VLAVLQDLRAVDEHVAHADGVLVRVLERRTVGNPGGIEDDNVGEHAFADVASRIELQVCGGQPTQPPHGLLERDDVFLAHVLAEQPGEITVGARVRGGLGERRLGCHGGRV